MMMVAVWCALLVSMLSHASGMTDPGGMLYPRESETREVTSLDGLWNFRLSPSSDHRMGFDQFWHKKDLAESGDVILMPVPSSYNDITMDVKIRDHVGLVWYDRKFFVSESWLASQKKVWLRFSSVSYSAQVWINGELVMNHDMGHLPFQREITSLLKFGEENRVTVACDNMLRSDTVPQGYITEVPTDEGKRLVQSYTFDFFNYAGIQRPVTLYTTPNIYIDDITVETDIEGDTGYVTYFVEMGGGMNYSDEYVSCCAVLLDRAGNPVAKDDGEGAFNGTLTVPLARFWWPYLMDPDPGYMYTLQVTLSSQYEDKLDVYRLPVGIRTLQWTNSNFLINNRTMYLHGFGRHEDSDIRGKGLDLPLIIRDYNLIKWVGANVYRTSHYPYADEIMDLADKMGIMIIDECPSVDTDLSFNCGMESINNLFNCLLTTSLTASLNKGESVMKVYPNEHITYVRRLKKNLETKCHVNRTEIRRKRIRSKKRKNLSNNKIESGYSASLLQKHKDSLTELIRRDKNRPGVIAWSIANEPRTQLAAADNYFGDVVKHVKQLDTSRPVTIALARGYFEDKAGKHLDIISFNRYNGWYANPGQLDMITQRVIQEAEAWHQKYNKPVLMSEYGADTYEGLHLYPEYVWSEDYQVELMSRHFKAFDTLREKGWFIGEFIWNFADFKTAQTTARVGGNKKGIFTRNRQPKASAHHLRRRYHTLANQLYNSPIPSDLYPYSVKKTSTTYKNTEL